LKVSEPTEDKEQLIPDILLVPMLGFNH